MMATLCIELMPTTSFSVESRTCLNGSCAWWRPFATPLWRRRRATLLSRPFERCVREGLSEQISTLKAWPRRLRGVHDLWASAKYGSNAPCFRPPRGGQSAVGGPARLRRTKGHRTMSTHRTLNRIIAGALLTGGVAAAGLGLASVNAQAEPGLTPLVWQMDDPNDQPPPPEPPPPPPRQCWALFIPAPCPPGQ
jgi:hypothetical protein